MGDTRLDHVALAVWRWSDARAETPPAGITALAATAGADPGFPAENHIDGWDVTPVLPELGVRLLTKFR